MPFKPNPFSLYDFLGYFTPGALFLYTVVSIAGISEINFEGTDYLPFVLGAYALGHLLNFLSSITIERYSIWTLGYPSRFLLNLPVPGFYGGGTWVEYVWRTLVFLFLIPISILDILLGKFARLRILFSKALDTELVALVNFKIQTLMNELGGSAEAKDNDDHDFFRVVYHYCVEYAPNHLPKMQNYVALYGFLRCLALIGVTAFWLVVAQELGKGWTVFAFLPMLLIAVLAFVAYMGFVKFYRRFSLEALMAVTVIRRE